jgi:hydroxymethylglutaryl-CoA reductase (NADPH)
MNRLPRDPDNDYTREIAASRRRVVCQVTNAPLTHVGSFSFDPTTLPGHLEGFVGVAQVPLGFAGPLLVDGEHAQGEFYVPLATTEGTLVASYNRGMRLTREAGGVRTTVVDDAMQRAPCFVFRDARAARAFGNWVVCNFDAIKAKAEETTRYGRLRNIEQYAVGKMRFLRFDFTTGDAAGQNMVTKATRHACLWIQEQGIGGLEHFALAANLDTDKKHSLLNSLHTRGKRVVAELTLTGGTDSDDHAYHGPSALRAAAALEPRQPVVGLNQQRGSLCEWDRRHVHRLWSGRGQRRGVIRGLQLRRDQG